MLVDGDAAAAVVGSRHDRDRLGAHVDPQLEAAPVDGGEVVDDEVPRQVGHVEHHVVVAGPLQLAVDRARHHVARGQVLHLVVAGHEGGAVAQPQDPALAAQGLADQERLRRRVIEAGRVELEELHVADPRADPVRHRHAVAGRDVGVGRVEVDLAAAAGGQHDRARDGGLDRAGFLIEQVGAEHRVRAAVLGGGQEIDRHVVGEHRDPIGALRHLRQQRGLDRPAGRVLDVDDAPRGVAPFAPQGEVAIRVAIERHAHLVGEAEDVLGRLARAELDDVAVAEAVADAQRVLDVGRDAVLGIERPGHATLRVGGVGVGGGPLGGDHHPPVLGGPQREVEPCQSRSDHQVVGLDHVRRVCVLGRGR